MGSDFADHDEFASECECEVLASRFCRLRSLNERFHFCFVYSFGSRAARIFGPLVLGVTLKFSGISQRPNTN
jgi:hypothetical protein